MKIALGQINPTLGDFDGNRRLLEAALAQAEAAEADLVVFPELALCGYPPRDLLERPAFLKAAEETLRAFTQQVNGRTAVLVGFPEPLPPGQPGRPVANAAALIERGRLVSVHRKALLPTYDVFDEARYFEPATAVKVVPFRGRTLGISICEDIWNDEGFWSRRLYPHDPIASLVDQGADLLVNVSASPFWLQKRQLRPRLLANTARRWGRPLVFVNQVGGHDDLIFDGSSMTLDATGQIIARAAEHRSDLVLVDLDRGLGDLRPPLPSDERSLWEALCLGTADYVRRCGFRRVTLGLSGGIDSAVVAAVAARALGPENVLLVFMPSRFTSSLSRRDATALAANLGAPLMEIPIEPMMGAFEQVLEPVLPQVARLHPFQGVDLMSENLQARIRGNLLMALSNRFGHLVLTTGNKSELATGYCTLYGDMAGGLAVLADLTKTQVYALAREINRLWAEEGRPPVIPESILTRAPSAELRENQTDQDSLPPYDRLDAVLEAHLVEELDRTQLLDRGFDPALVDDVLGRLRTNEYKRRQMPPGLKVSPKAFGPGRRMPIAQAFRDR